MLNHSSATHGDFGRNWEALYVIIQVCHKAVCQEQQWVKTEQQEVRLQKGNGIHEMKEKPQPIQNTNKAGPFLIFLFIDSWNVLKPWLLPVCQQWTKQTHSCPPHLPLQMLTLFRPFLSHSFAAWGWGKLKFRSHSDSSCRAVVVALIKNPNWNKSQPAQALQPLTAWRKREEKSKFMF